MHEINIIIMLSRLISKKKRQSQKKRTCIICDPLNCETSVFKYEKLGQPVRYAFFVLLENAPVLQIMFQVS